MLASKKDFFVKRKKNIRGELTIVSSIFKQQFAIFKAYWAAYIIFILLPIVFTLVPILIGRSISPNYEKNFESVTGASNAEAYMVLGSVVWVLVIGILWDFSTFLREEQLAGTLESLMMTPVSRFTLAIGRAVFSTTINLFFSLISVTLGLAIYSPEIFTSLTILKVLLSLIVLVISTIAMIGLSLVIGSLVIVSKEIESIINALQWIFGTIMGVFFSISLLPWPIRIFSLFFPGTWGLNDVRTIMLSTPPMLAVLGIIPHDSVIIDFVIIIILGIVWSVGGLKTFSWVVESTKKKEGLSKY